MTVAPITLERLQTKLTAKLGTINLGIVGDASHVRSGGYHIGAKTLRANGMSDDYSLKYTLDKAATHDYACACDVGGPADLQMTLGTRMVHALENQDPRVYGKIRGINAPFNGVTIDRRWDGEDPNFKLDDNIQDSSDRGHIHFEVYRTLVLMQSVMDGIFDVFAGIPIKFGPKDERYTETMTEEELLIHIRKENVDLARSLAKGGTHGFYSEEKLSGIVHDSGNGYEDRLRRLEK